MPLFAQFLRQAQILILKILNVFLRLKLSPSLNLNKNEHFSKVSVYKSGSGVSVQGKVTDDLQIFDILFISSSKRTLQ
jgi:hypothetical protein